MQQLLLPPAVNGPLLLLLLRQCWQVRVWLHVRRLRVHGVLRRIQAVHDALLLLRQLPQGLPWPHVLQVCAPQLKRGLLLRVLLLLLLPRLHVLQAPSAQRRGVLGALLQR